MTTEAGSPEYLVALEEIARSQAADFRAPVPAGTYLGGEEIEPGARVNWRKANSLMTAGGRALPDRVPLYDRERQDVSMVPPTIATKRIMKDPTRFTMTPQHFEARTPIDDTCEVCKANRGGRSRAFYSEYDLDAHKQILHPREFAMEERRRAESIRSEDRNQMTELMRMIIENQQPAAKGRKAAE
jgi:hypothetical protein